MPKISNELAQRYLLRWEEQHGPLGRAQFAVIEREIFNDPTHPFRNDLPNGAVQGELEMDDSIAGAAHRVDQLLRIRSRNWIKEAGVDRNFKVPMWLPVPEPGPKRTESLPRAQRRPLNQKMLQVALAAEPAGAKLRQAIEAAVGLHDVPTHLLAQAERLVDQFLVEMRSITPGASTVDGDSIGPPVGSAD